jgi:hypothetical protein
MTDLPPEAASATGELTEFIEQQRRLRRRAEFENAEQLRSRLAVLQHAVELRREEGARALAPLEAAALATEREATAARERCEQQRVQNQSALATLAGEIEAVTRQLNAPTAGYGVRGHKQWALAEGAEAGPGENNGREWNPDETHPGGRMPRGT